MTPTARPTRRPGGATALAWHAPASVPASFGPASHHPARPPSLAAVCRRVPARGDGVCPICRGCPHAGYSTCWSCATVTAQLRHPCRTVVPISLYTIPGELHGVLRRYKDARCPEQRARDVHALGELLALFVRCHEACLTGGNGAFDLLTTVPSSRRRPGPHPLIQAIRTDPWLAARHRELLARGPARLGHALASDLGFSPSRAVDGAGIVLLDDTWTTGARAQSAASVLQAHGARVLAIVVVGRVVDRAHSPRVQCWWQDQTREPFSLDQCCHETLRRSTGNDGFRSRRLQE